MIAYRDATPDDAAALCAMARRSFSETFGHLYPPADLAAFLDDAFGPRGLPADLRDPSRRVRIALADGAVAGFAKLAAASTLPPPATPADAELKQLYVLAPWHGAGIAAALMEWALAGARAARAPRLVLSVYHDNVRAQRFYARYGLREIGRAPFPVGATIDDDRIWSVDL